MNIAQLLVERAKEYPNKLALKAPLKATKNGEYTYESLTFLELLERSQSFALGLSQMGLKKGDKTLVFVRPGLDFPAITFALFHLGIIPVFIDPGMGKKNLLHSIKQVKPKALIGVPEVHFLRLFYRKSFSSITHFITTSNFTWGKMKSLNEFKSLTPKHIETKNHPDELAAILFTSGGTGIPKGVEYSHKIFSTQTRMLKEMFNLTHDDVDLPGFPLFALFTIAMGMTSCIPDMNPSKPGLADPKKLVQNILDNKATFVAGSPAIWERVAKYCTEQNISLPSVKYLVMFGAPVSTEIHLQFSKVLTNGTTYTPYGATESLPVANISGRYLLQNTVNDSKIGKGTCVGKPVKGVEVKIIEITDEVIANVTDLKEVANGTIGEIIIKGDIVTKNYFEMSEKTKEAKIYGEGYLWHRIGDLGYIDESGYLWFCGRKIHRVQTGEQMMSSIPCEAIFNEHPSVKRSALIGIKKTQSGYEKAGLVVELNKKVKNKQELKDQLLALGKVHSHTRCIEQIWFHDSFPVDVRHNIKIDRIKLRDLASNGSLK
ncbi:hypothetical protein A9Q84_12680 [Halobacteriovorax marinus]|uniref:AMP-dependent synthetase/ligase domain-containing protein n=1 Tax=Halobacteriovorax marinus TaxID=97084 RepID=A0A1Y5F8U0_9BACT|nr:hypothetical protein A9Q84_12680 [Halobacteriovorax marinus]